MDQGHPALCYRCSLLQPGSFTPIDLPCWSCHRTKVLVLVVHWMQEHACGMDGPAALLLGTFLCLQASSAYAFCHACYALTACQSCGRHL
jgi:hypothetical protein